MAARREHARAFAQIERRVRHVLDDRVRQHQIEGTAAERQIHAVGQREGQVRDAALAPEPDAGVLEPVRGIDADDERGLLGKRQRHAAAAAAGVEHAPPHGDAGSLEKRDDLGAAIVLEQRVVVFGAEPEVRVRLDGAFVNLSHARSRSSTPAVRRSELVDERRAIVAGRGLGHVERHDDPVIRVRVEHVLNDGIPRL